jgi:microcystin-dependent protein
MTYIGEIRMFAGNFAPNGWAFCDGQPIAIADNDPLFNLIGTTYGGDGVETFALPDLQGRLPVHMGTSSASGTTYQIGEKAGVESVTLSTQQIPSHTHPMLASGDVGNNPNPQGSVLAESSVATMYQSGSPASAMSAQSIGAVGGSQPHPNLQPYTCINFIISLYGEFPHQ